MTSEQGDERRREIIRRLEEEKARIDAEKARLNAEKARIDVEMEQRRAELEFQLGRANHPPLSNDMCPTCWIKHNRKVQLQPVSHEEDPNNYDRMVCRECGYVEDRRT
jgi:hypothetical protein